MLFFSVQINKFDRLLLKNRFRKKQGADYYNQLPEVKSAYKFNFNPKDGQIMILPV